MPGDDPCCKVQIVADRYDLNETLENEIFSMWTVSGGPSVRDLVKMFNKDVIDAICRENGEYLLDEEIDAFHDQLIINGDSTPQSGSGQLEPPDIGVSEDMIEAHLVAKTPFYKHLTEHVELEDQAGGESPDGDSRTQSFMNRMESLRSKVEAVTQTTITDLFEEDEVPHDSTEVYTHIQIYCQECRVEKAADDFVREGCQCTDGSSTES